MQLPTSALEGDDATLAPPTPYINGPAGAPLIFVIGDSISADAQQRIVWVGLNEQWDATFPNGIVYNDSDVAAAFNDRLNSLLPSHPNLHYADYDAYVQANATYRDSLLADIVQIHPTTFDGKVKLGNFEAWYSELYC